MLIAQQLYLSNYRQSATLHAQRLRFVQAWPAPNL
jgi:hypothetical protein